jgi:hypothetical protein
MKARAGWVEAPRHKAAATGTDRKHHYAEGNPASRLAKSERLSLIRILRYRASAVIFCAEHGENAQMSPAIRSG